MSAVVLSAVSRGPSGRSSSSRNVTRGWPPSLAAVRQQIGGTASCACGRPLSISFVPVVLATHVLQQVSVVPLEVVVFVAVVVNLFKTVHIHLAHKRDCFASVELVC